MSFLLDTNVVSEWIKPRPNPGVISWLEEVDEDRTRLSVITVTELRYGIERLPTSPRRNRLTDWLESELPLRFEARILSIDAEIANVCGKILARAEAIGRRLEAMDGFIAATAKVHGLALVTRNNSHFEHIIDQVLNPWT